MGASPTVFIARVRDSCEVQDIELVMQPPPAQRDAIALYRANFPSPLKFKSGDVLGVDQLPVTEGLAIQYAYGWGPDNYVLKRADTQGDSSIFVTSPVAVQDTLPCCLWTANHVIVSSTNFCYEI